jgi:hypothetical protein
MAGANTEKVVRDRNRRYLAYLLRLWQVREKGQVGWRASTENVHTGEQRGFSGLADLYAFIEGEVSQVGQVQPTRGLGDRGTDIERLS